MALFSILLLLLIVSYLKIRMGKGIWKHAVGLPFTHNGVVANQIFKKREKIPTKFMLTQKVTMKFYNIRKQKRYSERKSNKNSSWARTSCSIYLLLTYVWFDWICYSFSSFVCACMCEKMKLGTQSLISMTALPIPHKITENSIRLFSANITPSTHWNEYYFWFSLFCSQVFFLNCIMW